MWANHWKERKKMHERWPNNKLKKIIIIIKEKHLKTRNASTPICPLPTPKSYIVLNGGNKTIKAKRTTKLSSRLAKGVGKNGGRKPIWWKYAAKFWGILVTWRVMLVTLSIAWWIWARKWCNLTSEGISGGDAEEEGLGLTIFSKCHFNQQETKTAHR